MKKVFFVLIVYWLGLQSVNAQDFDHEFVEDFGSENWETISATLIDANDNAYVYGSFKGHLYYEQETPLESNGKRDIFVAKFLPDGTLDWWRNFGGQYDESAYSMVEKDGVLYLAGSFKKETNLGGHPLSTTSFTDVFFMKLDANQNVTKALALPGSKAAQKVFLQLNKANEIVMAGTFKEDITIDGSKLTAIGKTDIFYATYEETETSKKFINGVQFGGNDEDYLNDFIISSDDDYYLAGSFKGTIDLITPSINAIGKTDAFVGKMDAAGTVSWVKNWGGKYNDEIKKIALDGNNDVLLAGEYEHTITFLFCAMQHPLFRF